VGEYRIVLKVHVAAKLVSVEPSLERANLRRRISSMTIQPVPAGARALPGYDDRFSLRIGNHRIAYRLDWVRREVTIVAVRYCNRARAARCSIE
jgi:mRNA-degrading endonuclease RelE of RelBE toxin-antitoxin system